MLRRLAHLLLPALLCLPLAAETAGTDGKGFVQVRGRNFVGPDGQVLHLRGTNFGNWLLPEGYMWDFTHAAAPRHIEDVVAELLGDVSAAEFWRQWRDNFVAREDIRFLKAAGFNSVRIPLNWRLFVSADAPFQLEGPGWALLERLIGWCREEGLYAVIDLHAAPGGQTGANIDDSRGRPLLFEDPAAQHLTVELWREIARRYRDEPIILGYDLLNEPVADYHDKARYNPLLAAFYRRLVPAIREIDPHHIIFLGGAQWDTRFDEIGPPFAPNLAYTFHLYQDAPVEASIKKYLDWRDRTGAPLWLGESGEEKDDWIRRFRTLLEQHEIDWCFWTYKKIAHGRSVVTAPAPANWHAIVTYANKKRGADYDAIRAALPPLSTGRHALAELLENIRFASCRINDGYLRALGLTPPPAPKPALP